MDVAEEAVLLEDQDRRLRNQQLIAKGNALLQNALAADRPGGCPLRAATPDQYAGMPGLRPPAPGQGGGRGRMSVTSGAARNRIVPAPGQRPGPRRCASARSYGSREASMARYPLIGYLAWVVLFGALLVWEGLALAGVTGVPSLSGVFRVIMRYPVGRWVLFALWLWAGWHFFVRGWHFLLRA
jgi:hypothetical protein